MENSRSSNRRLVTCHYPNTEVKEILIKCNYRLPFMSDVKYNKGLKDIYKMLDDKGTIQIREGSNFVNRPKWKEFSRHDLIKTFITRAANRGIPNDGKICSDGFFCRIILYDPWHTSP